MNEVFALSDERRALISQTKSLSGQVIVSGLGLGLSDKWVGDQQVKADLLERRLSRIESALGLEPICAD